MTIALIALLIVAGAIAFLIRNRAEQRKFLPRFSSGWYPVCYATSDYDDVLCGLALEVKKKEGPYIYLRSWAITLTNAFGQECTGYQVEYKREKSGDPRVFASRDPFPLSAGDEFYIYEAYKWYGDGGAVLQLVAVPKTVEKLSKREIRKRRMERCNEILVERFKRPHAAAS